MFPSLTTFDDFLAAYGESLSTQYFDETYPDYAEELQTMEGDVNEKYIRHFFAAGLDPQEGLSKFLDCIFENTRYAQEQYAHELIQHFLDAGASLFPLTSKIMAILTDESDIEETQSSIEIRAIVLDTFWRQLDQDSIQSITNWADVKPKYWEYIAVDEDPFITSCRYFKCCSDYLRGEHQRFAGSECEAAQRENAKMEFWQKMIDESQDDM